MKVLADKWKNMSQARKEPYEKQAEFDARRYHIEVNLRPSTEGLLGGPGFHTTALTYVISGNRVDQRIFSGQAYAPDHREGGNKRCLSVRLSVRPSRT